MRCGRAAVGGPRVRRRVRARRRRVAGGQGGKDGVDRGRRGLLLLLLACRAPRHLSEQQPCRGVHAEDRQGGGTFEQGARVCVRCSRRLAAAVAGAVLRGALGPRRSGAAGRLSMRRLSPARACVARSGLTRPAEQWRLARAQAGRGRESGDPAVAAPAAAASPPPSPAPSSGTSRPSAARLLMASAPPPLFFFFLPAASGPLAASFAAAHRGPGGRPPAHLQRRAPRQGLPRRVRGRAQPRPLHRRAPRRSRALAPLRSRAGLGWQGATLPGHVRGHAAPSFAAPMQHSGPRRLARRPLQRRRHARRRQQPAPRAARAAPARPSSSSCPSCQAAAPAAPHRLPPHLLRRAAVRPPAPVRSVRLPVRRGGAGAHSMTHTQCQRTEPAQRLSAACPGLKALPPQRTAGGCRAGHAAPTSALAGISAATPSATPVHPMSKAEHSIPWLVTPRTLAVLTATPLPGVTQPATCLAAWPAQHPVAEPAAARGHQ